MERVVRGLAHAGGTHNRVEGKGRQMLEKLGWGGQGLGVHGEGMLEPLIPTEKHDRHGVDYHRGWKHDEPQRHSPFSDSDAGSSSADEGEDDLIVIEDPIPAISENSNKKRRGSAKREGREDKRRRQETHETHGGDEEDTKMYPLFAMVLSAKREVQRKLMLRAARRKMKKGGASKIRQYLMKQKDEGIRMYQDLIAFRDHLNTLLPQQPQLAPKEPSGLSVRELKDLLTKHEISHAHCVEKEELVRLFVEHGLEVGVGVGEDKGKEKETGKIQQRQRLKEMVEVLLAAFQAEKVEEEYFEEIVDEEEADDEVEVPTRTTAPLDGIIIEDDSDENQQDTTPTTTEGGAGEVIDLTGDEAEKGDKMDIDDTTAVVEGETEKMDIADDTLQQPQPDTTDTTPGAKRVRKVKMRWHNNLTIDRLMSVLEMVRTRYEEEYHTYQIHWLILAFLFSRLKNAMKSRWKKWLSGSIGGLFLEEEGMKGKRDIERKVRGVAKLKESLKPWEPLLHSSEHTYLHPAHTRREKDSQRLSGGGGGRGRGRRGGQGRRAPRWSVFAADEEDEENNKGDEDGDDDLFFSFTEEGATYFCFIHFFLEEQIGRIVNEAWRDATHCDTILSLLQGLHPTTRHTKKKKVEDSEKRTRIDELGLEALRRRLIDNVCVPKLKAAIDSWELHNTHSAQHSLPHLWIHPWLPLLMEKGRLDQDLVRYFFETRLANLTQSSSSRWHPSDLLEVISPWKPILAMPDYNRLLPALTQTLLVPKFEAMLDEELVLSPIPNQEDEDLLAWIFDWEELLTVDTLVGVLSKAFFPRWIRYLQGWLSNSNQSELTAIGDWYSNWKGILMRLSPRLKRHITIRRELNRALHLMHTAATSIITPTSTKKEPEVLRRQVRRLGPTIGANLRPRLILPEPQLTDAELQDLLENFTTP